MGARPVSPSVVAPAESGVVDYCELRGIASLSAEQAEEIKSTVNRAVHYFQAHFGSVHHPVTVDLEPEGALRTGFNVSDNAVHFPVDEKGARPDLNSRDIITHEVFHALTFQSYPEYCTSEKLSRPEFVRLHESLADYFTHQLYPDAHFAEDRSPSGQPLRSYRNDRRIGLSAGGHAQGNAITSYLLKHDIRPPDVRNFLESGNFTLESLSEVSPSLTQDLALDAKLTLTHRAENHPQSTLNRYRLEESKPLKLIFSASEELTRLHPNLSIQWVRPSGMPSANFRIEPSGAHDFTVSSNGGEGAEKVLALFKDGDRLIGARPFYFSSGKPGTNVEATG